MVHAVVGGVEAAVAADEHVPAVARVDPEGVLIGVDAVAAVVLERLAAVGRAVEADAEDVNVLVVAGIDADLAEVHRPRIDAVDARPRFAAVGRFVDAAVLETVRPLLILARFPAGRRTRSPTAAFLLAASNRQLAAAELAADLQRLLVAPDGQRQRVAGLVSD